MTESLVDGISYQELPALGRLLESAVLRDFRPRWAAAVGTMGI